MNKRTINRLISYIIILITIIFLKIYSQINHNYIYEVKFIENMSDTEKYIYYDILGLAPYNYSFENDITIQNSLYKGIFKLNNNSFFCYLKKKECIHNLKSIFTNNLIDHNQIFNQKFQSKINNDNNNFKNTIFKKQRFCNFLKSADVENLIINDCKSYKPKKNAIDTLIEDIYLNSKNLNFNLWIYELGPITKKNIVFNTLIKEIIIIITLLILSFSFIELVIKKNGK